MTINKKDNKQINTRKSAIPYPWEWYSKKIQYMVMDKNGAIFGYTKDPVLNEIKNRYDCKDGDKAIRICISVLHKAHMVIIKNSIPWYETKRRRPH